VPVAFELVRPYNELLSRTPPQKLAPSRLTDLRDPFHYVPRPTYEVASGAVKVGGMQPVAVVASTGEQGDWSEGDLFRAVAGLAKRKGQNAIRPDLIRVPLSGLSQVTPLAEELQRRSEEEDPGAGKSALALIVDAGTDYALAATSAADVTNVGAIQLQAVAGEQPDWQEYEDCVRAALLAHVPLWLQAVDTRSPEELLADVLSGLQGFPAVDLLLDMTRRANALGHRGLTLSLQAQDPTPSYLIRAYRLLSTRLTEAGRKYPLHLDFVDGQAEKSAIPKSEHYQDDEGPSGPPKSQDRWLIGPSVAIGSLLCDGIGNSVEIAGDGTADEQVALAFNVLQAAGSRTIKAEFVACPSCGRTLFDLQETTERIKAATGHLRGVKIAVMGCIVNGLGELADADFGYMGGAPGKVNLFVGKECVEKGVPTPEAVGRLIDIIKTHGKWVEPTVRS